MELKPDNPNIHYNLGLAYEDLEQYENAIQAFQESNRIKPDDYDTYNSLGRVYNLMEKYQEALESFRNRLSSILKIIMPIIILALLMKALNSMKTPSKLTKKLFTSNPIISMPIMTLVMFIIISIETKKQWRYYKKPLILIQRLQPLIII